MIKTTKIAAIILLAGCSEPIATNLPESTANEVLLALAEQGITASKIQAKNRLTQASLFRIEVPDSKAQRALAILKREGLPKAKATVSTKSSSLFSTPADVHAVQQRQLEQTLERTLESIATVVRAHVHLARDQQQLPNIWRVPDHYDVETTKRAGNIAKASVLLHTKHDPSAQGNSLPQGAVQRLIAGAVRGLQPENVVVVRAPRPRRALPQSQASLTTLASIRVHPEDAWKLLAACFILLATTAALALWLLLGERIRTRTRKVLSFYSRR